MVSLSSGLKAILKADHSMLKLKMLNQTHFLSNMVYHKVLPLVHFCFFIYINDMPNRLEKEILEHLLMTPLYSTLPILYRTLEKL